MLLVWSIPTILTRPTTVVELSVFYLMIISYFFTAWIWPAKSLLQGLNEVRRIGLFKNFLQRFQFLETKSSPMSLPG